MTHADEPKVAPQRARSRENTFIRSVPEPARNVVLEIGQMCQLLGQVLYSAIRYPKGYWKDVLDEMYDLFKLCFWPSTLSMAGYGFIITVLGIGLLGPLGAASRMGAFMWIAFTREIAAFMVAMIVAGVIGTAITADLGARRTRDELDALKVLGLNAVRMLVLPRVIASAVMCALLFCLTSFVGVLLGVLAVKALTDDASVAAYLNAMENSMFAADIWGAVLKAFLTGLLIGVICSHKGFTAGGGPEGVGRAVNQAVVISFATTFIFNFFFNALIQGLNPTLTVLR